MTTSHSPEPTPQPEPENYTTRLQVGPSAWPGILALLVVLGLGVVGYMYFTGQIVLRPDPNTPEGKVFAQKETAEKNVEFAHRADNALNTVTWSTAEQKLLDAESSHRSLLDTQVKLIAELKRLGEGTEGKRIATQQAWVDQFITIRDRERLSDAELAAQLRTIQTLLPVCKEALKEKIVLPCDDRFLVQVESANQTLSKAKREADEDLKSLTVLVGSTQAAAPSNQSLSAIASARKETQRLQSLSALTQERDKQRLELERTAREQELAAERTRQEAKLAADQKIRDAELAREKADQARRIAEANAEAERVRRDLKLAEEQRERERIRRERVAKFEAALPGIKSMLSPFIATGKMQYVPGKGWRESDPGPLSLAALQATGGLKDEPGSHSRLMNVCVGGNSSNDRPVGGFPTWRPEAGNQIEREVRRVQAFLRDYGDLLVERGMLLP